MAAIYPKADLEIDGTNLYSLFDLNVKEVNGAKPESTFRKKGAGVSFGESNATITFKIKRPATPAEKNWRAMIRKRKIKQIVIKLPDGTRDVYNGAFSDRDMQSGLEGAVEETLTFVGHAEDAEDAV